ncbi:GNAT family N-acetyltransferase [Marinifilum sp. N1E240]|uniref:GNAT family N-acetyltransferase n=1 Tax=Marinifilum sp. N1E240 TaxID=2608082 RepID=UPI00128E8CE1|nr:GNAT family N-acetyltransferase [Marinifilum sp. N1E240]MPQ46845.1 GNAT family N-acetyltransferase [Marinifilum sp. N1E240]
MIRKYAKEDKIKVIELVKLNTPKYFDPSEENDLKNYLDKEVEDYFVVELESVIVGAGGINYFPEEKIARISWDMIHPDYQGKGVGKSLIKYRIDYIKAKNLFKIIEVRTSQLVADFYNKMGFELVNIEKDYWAKDYDLYQMIYKK